MSSLPLKIILNSVLMIYSGYTYSITSKSDVIKNWMKKDGYLVISIPVKPEKFDPILPINAHTKFTLPLIFESLITINAEQELQPVLAKQWSVSSDGKSIIISIKPGHHFSDNTEVTANDVVRSINYLCSYASNGFGEMKGLIGCEEQAKGSFKRPEVYALGKYDIQFNIQTNPTTFLFQLSSPTTVITKTADKGLIGSGPYKLVEKSDDYATLGRNQFYSGNIQVKNSGLILFYTSGHIISKTLINDQPDAALMYRMEELFNFKNDNYKLIQSNPNITGIFVLNNQKFPFNSSLLRKALAANIYNNFDYSCMPGGHKSYGIIPNGIGGSITNVQPKIMKEIPREDVISKIPELREKVTITIQQLDDTKNDCATKQIIQAAKTFNINVKFQFHKDYSDLMPHYLNHKLDAFIDLYIFKNREAYRIIEFFAKNGENHANIRTSKIDSMLKEAISANTSHARFQVYRKVAQLIQDENIVIPLFYMDHANLMNKCLSGISNDFFFNPFSELPKISKDKNCIGKQ